MTKLTKGTDFYTALNSAHAPLRYFARMDVLTGEWKVEASGNGKCEVVFRGTENDSLAFIRKQS